MSPLIGSFIRSFLILLAATSMSPLLFGQARPNLGTASTYGAFTSVGGISNTGLTQLNGDIGTNAGAFTGFPPGVYTGAKHVADPQSLAVKNDLTIAWNQMGAIPCDATLSVTMGNGQVLTPKTYCLGPASTITGTLTLDAQGNPNAIFIIKVGGALNVAATSKIILTNLAQAANVYWRIDGAVSILDNSIFKGTIVANGAIHLYGGTTLEGRALSIVGAVTMASNSMTVPVTPPPGSLTVVRPAAGDTLIGGMQNYRIEYVGVNVTLAKRFEYSLDGGATWTTIGAVRNDSSSYGWNVPDSASTRVLVRITDSNGIVGTSNMFTIKTSAGGLTVVRPAAGDTIIGGTQNYRIEFVGTNLAKLKTFEYSLDSGATWVIIGVVRNDSSHYAWNVPPTPSNRALVRITDSNGVTGTSGMFTIILSTGSLTVVRPAAGDTIIGGTQNYRIEFIGVNATQWKKFEYSLDNGATWNTIGTVRNDSSSYGWNVPATPSTQALVRITDSNGVTGTSGMFTITAGSGGVGSINSLTLTGLVNGRIGNAMPMEISWTFTPDIGTSIDVEYSLDNGITWTNIATLPTSAPPNVMWTTPASGTYTAAFIRVKSTLGMQRMSEVFRIGAPIASVADNDKAKGYSIMNFPNPASSATTIRFQVPVQSLVRIAVADGLGREVRTVASGSFEAGSHSIPFDAAGLPNGVYTCILEVGTTRVVGMMTVVK
jgi:hypothetical protein